MSNTRTLEITLLNTEIINGQGDQEEGLQCR